MWENTVTIHGILKENNYKAKFLTSSILKKIKSIKIILEKINEKRKRKMGKVGKKKVILEKKINEKKRGGKLKKKMKKKKKEECPVDYCCNPQCIGCG